MFPTGDDRVPGKGLGLVTIVFIALNALVFLFLQGAGSNETFTYGYAAVPLEITTGDDLTTPQVIETSEGPVEVPQEPGPNPIFLTLLTSM
ncbi:MAG: rhomboid family intramembrane serine protease, partial [Acidimicrobiia bacterium]